MIPNSSNSTSTTRAYRAVDTARPKAPWDYHIPMWAGRPDRSRVIGADDVTDLVIMLNTARSIDELCGRA